MIFFNKQNDSKIYPQVFHIKLNDLILKFVWDYVTAPAVFADVDDDAREPLASGGDVREVELPLLLG